MRLNRFLALCGLGSRRKCEELISQGLVAVNGSAVSEPSLQVLADEDRVTVGGETVLPPRKHVYIMLNKPKGIVTTTSDPQSRRTVISFLPPNLQGIPHVGRLDKNSEGLLVFTTDGDVAFRMTHPRHGVPRFYRVELSTPFPGSKLKDLVSGTSDRGEHLSVSKARLSGRDKKSKRLDMVLGTGKKREIRRLLSAFGFKVTRILRYGFGPLRLGDLASGAIRPLTAGEVAKLKKDLGLD